MGSPSRHYGGRLEYTHSEQHTVVGPGGVMPSSRPTERERTGEVIHPRRWPTRRKTGCGPASWLILPVVICLSQRISHACLSTPLAKGNCEWLIKSAVVP